MITDKVGGSSAKPEVSKQSKEKRPKHKVSGYKSQSKRRSIAGCRLLLRTLAAATVRDLAGFLADGVDSVDEEGTLASVQDVAPGCCCCCELATVSFVATAVLDFLVKNEARLDCRDFAAVEWSRSFRLRPC